MNGAEKILLCSDLDGTLLSSDSKLSDENRQAIKEFVQDGGKFCLATGRLPNHLLKYFDKSEFLCPVICCNGACIYDFANDKILYKCLLGNKIYQIMEYISHNKDHLQYAYYFADLKKYDIDLDKIADAQVENAYKIVLVMDTPDSAVELRDNLRKHFGTDYDFSRSWPVGVEILNANATKGKTVKRMKDILGDGRITICVGDNENDISMIKSADIGCAVENAVDELKAVADKVICSNDDHAIKYIVENILKMFTRNG